MYNLNKYERGVISVGSNKKEDCVRKDIRQLLSSHLFNLYVEKAIYKVRKEIKYGVKVRGEK